MISSRPLWHVTSRATASDILASGFLGSWGDAGFGVYLFDSEAAARSWAAAGGWDGSLFEPVLLRVDADPEAVTPVIPHPDWPDPEAYSGVLFHAMEGDAETWCPPCSIHEVDAPCP